MMRILKTGLLCALATLASAAALGQTLTTYTGIIKDLAQNPVTSGQVTFTLAPPTDATVPGVGRFTPVTLSCNINVDGTLSGYVGGIVSGACVVTMNTALSPQGTSYRICIQPQFSTPGSCFYDYALQPSKDISTIVPTLSTGAVNYGGVPGPPLNFLGAWSAATSYPTGGVVSYNNLVYISLTNANLNNTPSTSPSSWSVVISPASLLALPTGAQAVVQPTGTTLGVNSLNGVLEATQQAGSDIGAKVNAAIALRSGACGTISIAPGSYSFNTQIQKPRCVMIEGNNAVLTWTGTNINTPAIVAGSVTGIDDTIQGGIRHLKLVGNPTASGIYLGNKVGSYNVPSNPNIQELLDTFLDVNVIGFYDNYVKGSNVFQDTWIAGSSQQAAHAGWNDSSSFGSENMAFFGWEILNGQGGMGFYSPDLRGSEYNFFGCSFDYNSGGAFNYIDGIVRIYGGHIEEFSNMGPLFTSPASSADFALVLSGGLSIVIGCDPHQGTCTTLPDLITVGGTNSNVTIDKGLTMFLAANMTNATTNLVQWNAAGGSNILIVEPYTNLLVPTGINLPAVQAGANIQWLDVPVYSQFIPTNNITTDGTFHNATIGALGVGSHYVGSTANGCPSAVTGVDFPFNGNFLGWNCDVASEADYYNPAILNTNVTAFDWKTILNSGAWTSLMTLSRGGALAVKSIGLGAALNNNVGLQVATGAGVSVAAGVGAFGTSTVNLATPEPDTNYVVTGCSINGYTGTGWPVLGDVNAKTTSSISVFEFNLSSANAFAGGTITCLVAHN
jgi:hypothetical protein